MALRDRYITFDGTNLKTAYGLIYSSFEEELPEPKVIKVEIPAGLDLDITEAVGLVGWHNGKHTFKFLMYGSTQAERLSKRNAIIALLHGRRANYSLSWDSGYTYTGRASVAFEHFTETADLVTVEIDRVPWKTHSRESVDVNSHPYSTYHFNGSPRFNNVRATTRQWSVTKMGSEASVTHESAGTFTLASDLYTQGGDITLIVQVEDWLMYVDGNNLVVNSEHITISGSNAVIDDTYTITNENIEFDLEKKQHTTVSFTRMDL